MGIILVHQLQRNKTEAKEEEKEVEAKAEAEAEEEVEAAEAAEATEAKEFQPLPDSPHWRSARLQTRKLLPYRRSSSETTSVISPQLRTAPYRKRNLECSKTLHTRGVDFQR